MARPRFVFSLARGFEHDVHLLHHSGIAEENVELATPLSLFVSLNLVEQFLGIQPGRF